MNLRQHLAIGQAVEGGARYRHQSLVRCQPESMRIILKHLQNGLAKRTAEARQRDQFTVAPQCQAVG